MSHWVAYVALATLALGACKRLPGGSSATGAASASAGTSATSPNAISSIVVDHGELDTKAPLDAPKLASKVIAATIYKLPDVESRKLGYVRLGGVLSRDPHPVEGKGCVGEWYRVYPMGHVCTAEATTNVDEPLVRAAARRADLGKPLPYRYGFVRATAPQYLRVPTKKEQIESEFKLEEHLATFEQNVGEWQAVVSGANDVPLDRRGLPIRGGAPTEARPSTALGLNELFGGDADENRRPFWLEGGRAVPNVSGFDVPAYAVFADRVRRKTGLSFVDAFVAEDGGLRRRFAVTVDLRLIPTTKVKPDTGSPFHGIEITEGVPVPFALVAKRDSKTYKLIKNRDEARTADDLPHRVVVPLTGHARIKAGRRFYQTLKDPKRWVAANDVGVVALPPTFPPEAEKGEKWIDISLLQQTLVLYEGKRPWYATLVSTGRDRIGDPKTTLATPQGSFRLKSKHVAAAMDSEENSTVLGGSKGVRSPRLSDEALATVERLRAAEKNGEKLSEEDQRRLLNVKKGRHPEYGVTMRRGSENFELRDVPWIQYFAAGYAIHGAYWHDVFGVPRSHGCVNLSPVDARVAFLWTDPPVPDGWHGVNVGPDMGEGTLVVVRE